MEEESNRLEILTEQFSRHSGDIYIKGISVYGCINKKSECLGTTKEYDEYNKLRTRHKHYVTKSDKQKEEAYKSFLETKKSRD